MSKKTVWINLDAGKVDITYLDNFFAKNDVELIAKPIANEEASTIEMGLKADAIISIAEPWNEHTLGAVAGKGKFIIRYGMGMDNIDIPAATRLGIPVANLPGANSPAVAEVALLHILNAGRRFVQCESGVRGGVWPSTIPGNELDGKTLGLLGYGNIARHLARMVSGFECKVIAFDTFVTDAAREHAAKYGVELVETADDIFRRSDIVSLHIPLVDETRRSINKRCFDLMKQGAYLVNTCRGGVIDEPDLKAAIESGKLRGAGLDVLTDEPMNPKCPLLHMPQVWITSHMGAASLESEHRSQVILGDTIMEFFGGKLPFNVRNPEVAGR